MALLDVTEVLLDPDFMDRSLSVKRSAQAVGADGLAVLSTLPTPISFAGVVTSNNGSLLTRIAEGERVADTIIIHSMFGLSDGQAGQTADIVTWQGKQWTVVSVNDYSHFGRGFVSAVCELIPLTG